MIIFHKILKSGFHVEDCRLGTADRLIRYLALMSIVTWRIFWLTHVARVAPETCCLIFLNDFEWKILFRTVKRDEAFPGRTPSMKETVGWISQLGGFLARKKDKEPGITHLWRGLKKFAAILEGVEIAKDIYG